MSNVFEVSTLIAKNMTQFFDQKSALINTANNDYLEAFNQTNYATGGSINIKVPGYPSVQKGLVTTAEGIEDLVVSYSMNADDDMYNVVRELSLFEQRFDILRGEQALTKPVRQAIVDNYAYPAFQSIEGQLESTAAYRMKTTAFYTPIDTREKLGGINSYPSISQIDTMAESLKFMPERTLMMNLQDAQYVADSLQNMFNEPINTKITKTARIDKGRLASFDVFRSTQVVKHVAGPLADTSGITVSSVAADGSTITLTGVPSTTSKLINAGDMISLPDTFLVDPITYNQLPYRLVVTAAQDANGNGSGSVTVTLSYPLLASGEHANVASLPSNGDTALVYPDHNLNYAYTKSGLSVVPVTLGDIYGAANSKASLENSRVPVKVVLQGQVNQFTNVFRITMMAGVRAFANYVIKVPSLAN